MDEAGVAQGRAVLESGVGEARRVFGARLLAAYALGSLARGGFSARVSDVDLGLILSDRVSPTDWRSVEEIARAVVASGLPLAERISIFWSSLDVLTTRPSSGAVPAPDPGLGRFPPLDRMDLLRHGRLLHGQDVRAAIPAPTARQLDVAGVEFALTYLRTPERQQDMAEPERLIAKGALALTKAVLFPVRLLHTARTGEVGGNRASVEHYDGAHAELAEQAYRWRMGEPIDRDVAVALLRRSLVPLYRELATAYERRMADEGEAALADGLRAWQHELEQLARPG